MNFASDNAFGAAPHIIDALHAASSGPASSYGGDEITARLHADMARLFEREVAVYPVTTGTAANALALATLVPSHGAKLVPLAGRDAKLAPATIEQALLRFHRGFVHHPQPAAISITQATELG